MFRDGTFLNLKSDSTGVVAAESHAWKMCRENESLVVSAIRQCIVDPLLLRREYWNDRRGIAVSSYKRADYFCGRVWRLSQNKRGVALHRVRDWKRSAVDFGHVAGGRRSYQSNDARSVGRKGNPCCSHLGRDRAGSLRSCGDPRSQDVFETMLMGKAMMRAAEPDHINRLRIILVMALRNSTLFGTTCRTNNARLPTYLPRLHSGAENLPSLTFLSAFGAFAFGSAARTADFPRVMHVARRAASRASPAHPFHVVVST